MSLNYKTVKDTAFTSGDSPVVIDLQNLLGALAQSVVIFNDGNGDLDVEMSLDGSTYGGVHTVKEPEVFGINGASISSVRITWVSDSAYRIVFSDKDLIIREGGEGKEVGISNVAIDKYDQLQVDDESVTGLLKRLLKEAQLRNAILESISGDDMIEAKGDL